MRLRGPDSKGIWEDEKAGIGLGHSRLAILDLSHLGNQPMHSECGRFVICYNGEIYNFREIASRLQDLGHRFVGDSDTEVALAAISEWGVEKAVCEFVGMFAFGLWDQKERTLTLCRDRIGIKPLYVGLDRNKLVFASELKPFRATLDFDLTINRDALTLLLRHNYIPAPHSIFEKVYKLQPGNILRINQSDLEKNELPSSFSFWDAKHIVESRGLSRFDGSPEEAVSELETHLRNAVGDRMISDVPLGAFLSGGIDSSTVVALMQAQSTQPVRTFSIGFEEEKYNEAVHAAKVAQHLGTDHTELYVTQQEAQNVIPKLPQIFDEPFSDSSQIPTFLVSQLARRDVTVSLSGDGGDELFGGYPRYALGERITKRMFPIPRLTRKLGAHALTLLSESQWNQLRLPGHRIHKLAEMLELTTPGSVYRSLVSHWKNPAEVVIDGKEPLTKLTDPEAQLSGKGPNFQEQMMYLDLVSYLPGDILTKVDRASMGVSLEARVPLLDHRVVEFAWSLPFDYKVRNGETKWILSQVLGRFLPKLLFDRPKMGFGIPVGEWLRGELREWAEELLDEERLKQEGYFEPRQIRQTWEEHLSNRSHLPYHLWDVLMFQAWNEEWREA